MKTKKCIWIFQDGEPLPMDGGQRLLRTGMLADEFHQRGWSVVWFSSRFDHRTKTVRNASRVTEIREDFQIILLEGRGYKRNISPRRIQHHHDIARDFENFADSTKYPDFIFASWPSPELCNSAIRFATKRGISSAVDIRDAWPAIFSEYLPKFLAPILWVLNKRYELLLSSVVRGADLIYANSKTTLNWALAVGDREQTESTKVTYLAYPKSTNEKSKTIKQPLKCAAVCTFGKSYDVGAIIETAKNFSRDSSIEFYLIGSGEDLEYWKSQAKGIPNIYFTGWKTANELQILLSEMDVGLLLMKGGVTKYTIPNKFGEYLCFSLAILNSIPGELSEIISTSSCGINLGVDVQKDLTQALTKFIDNPELIVKYQSCSRELFEKSFNANKVYSLMYEELSRVSMRGENNND